MADYAPNLYRVAATTLVIALAGNVLLWWITADDDTFANIVAVASGVAAGLLVITAATQLARWRDDAMLVAVAVWVANLIEFATETGVPAESRARGCCFYAAFAVLALGTHVALRRGRT